MPRSTQANLIILFTALAAWGLLGLPRAPVHMVRTAVVEPGELIKSVPVSGVVSYMEQQPLVSPQAGVIRTVWASPGQPVSKGQLLFELDTTAQEEALSVLYAMKDGLEEGSWGMLSDMQRWEWTKTEADLMRTIAFSRIRAPHDGVMEAVYGAPGKPVQAGELLGSTVSSEKCILAAVRTDDAAGIRPGAAAVVEGFGAAVVHTVHAPQENGMQHLTLVPDDAQKLSQAVPGERAAGEVICGVWRAQALIPLAAVDEEGCVWVVEDGCAHSCQADISHRSAQAVAADAQWAGRRVILSPTEDLRDGCRVKEAQMR